MTSSCQWDGSATSKARLSEVGELPSCSFFSPGGVQVTARMEEPGSLHHHVEESHLLHRHIHYMSERHTSAAFEPLHIPGPFCFSALAELRHTMMFELRPERRVMSWVRALQTEEMESEKASRQD